MLQYLNLTTGGGNIHGYTYTIDMLSPTADLIYGALKSPNVKVSCTVFPPVHWLKFHKYIGVLCT